jgi:hypothetical protein
VVTSVVTSLQRALASRGQEPAGSAVQNRLAGLRAPAGEGRPVDIHIRVAPSELELDVQPGESRPSPAGPGALDFRTWLLTRLRDTGLSQESAAKRIGVSARTVGRWARGETQPRMRDLGRVREVLGDLPAF